MAAAGGWYYRHVRKTRSQLKKEWRWPAPTLHGLATAEAEPELVGVESTEAKVFSQAEEIAFIPA